MRRSRIALIIALSTGFSSAGFAEDPSDTSQAAWTGKIALGGSLSAGTTDTLGVNVSIGGERNWGPNLVRLGFDAQYGKTNKKHSASVTDSNRQVLTEYFRRTISDDFYLYNENEQARDRVQNINLRLLSSVGPGYRVWENEDGGVLDIEAGVGYRYEDYGRSDDPSPGPLPGGDGIAVRAKSRNDVTGRAALFYKRKIGLADLGQTAEFLLPFNDTGAWLARAETKLSLPVLESWSFENTLGLEFANAPPVDTDKFELDYVISLVYAF